MEKAAADAKMRGLRLLFAHFLKPVLSLLLLELAVTQSVEIPDRAHDLFHRGVGLDGEDRRDVLFGEDEKGGDFLAVLEARARFSPRGAP